MHLFGDPRVERRSNAEGKLIRQHAHGGAAFVDALGFRLLERVG
jgi:hypothetical protein